MTTTFTSTRQPSDRVRDTLAFHDLLLNALAAAVLLFLVAYLVAGLIPGKPTSILDDCPELAEFYPAAGQTAEPSAESAQPVAQQAAKSEPRPVQAEPGERPLLATTLLALADGVACFDACDDEPPVGRQDATPLRLGLATVPAVRGVRRRPVSRGASEVDQPSQPSPGPWFWSQHRTDNGGRNLVCRCEITDCDDDVARDVIVPNAADAALIRSAPDLLAACELVLSRRNYRGEADCSAHILAIVESAIAKARRQ